MLDNSENSQLTALARILSDQGAIKFGKFRLKAHGKDPNLPLSPVYVDLRQIGRLPASRRLIAECIIRAISDRNISCALVADIPQSISPIVALLSDKLGRSQLTIRPEAKDHGLTEMILGSYEPGQTVLLVDDVITKATSKLASVAVLRQAGLVVNDVLVLVDRGQGGQEELATAGINLHSLFTLRQLCEFYREQQLIDDQIWQQLVEYFNWQ